MTDALIAQAEALVAALRSMDDIFGSSTDAFGCGAGAGEIDAVAQARAALTHADAFLRGVAEVEVAVERESGEPFLQDRADGVKGHYCIARKSPRGEFCECWRNGDWQSAGQVFDLTDSPRRGSDE